jgi:16S rRNA (cytosine967-C5)-methyltransferase
MREDNQVRQILKIIDEYDFNQPLSRFLSDYYRTNKQMGSRDRRQASQLIYSYFRLGKACYDKPPEERLAIGTYLCSEEVSEFNTYLFEKHTLPSFIKGISIQDKFVNIQSKYPEINLESVFPFSSHLSKGLDKNDFIQSFFSQPKLFIRIRKKYRVDVIKDLRKNNISFNEVSGHPLTISFSNTTSLNTLDTYKKGFFEIQDKSSQLTGEKYKASENEYWWDCCAASGGKSLLLADQVSRIKIMASDIRESILNNLKERFKKVQFKNFNIQSLDLSSDFILDEGPFDGIILDAPCTGSGTWARAPERIAAFDENEILKFKRMQQSIATSVLPYLKPGKPLIYSTCSVFKEENEEIVDFLIKNHPLKFEEMALIKGYAEGADSMFVARLIKV